MDTKQIAELRELLGKAVAGTWRIHDDVPNQLCAFADSYDRVGLVVCESDCLEDLRLIAAMKNALPALLDAAERVAGWRPMSSAPKDGTRILIRNQDGRRYMVANWRDGAVNGWIDEHSGVYWREPDAWSLLPDTEDPLVAKVESLAAERDSWRRVAETLETEKRDTTAERDRLKAKVERAEALVDAWDWVRGRVGNTNTEAALRECSNDLSAALKETP